MMVLIMTAMPQVFFFLQYYSEVQVDYTEISIKLTHMKNVSS